MAERFLKYETTNENLPVDNNGVLTNDTIVIKKDDVVFRAREESDGTGYLGTSAALFERLKEAIVNEKSINVTIHRIDKTYRPFMIDSYGFGYDEETEGYKYEVVVMHCFMGIDTTMNFYIFPTDEARENY